MFGHGRRVRAERIEASAFDAALAAELLAMADDETRLAESLRTSGTLARTLAPIDDPTFAAQNAAHAERIWELLDDYEMWPGRRLVGEDGATAAWMIVMHAQRDLDLQRRALEHLDLALEFDDVPGLHYATLADRIAMSDGLPQRFGTQLVPTADGRDLEAWPIEEREGLDGRRATLGLEPFAEQLARARAAYGAR